MGEMTLPKPAEDWIEAQVATGRHADAASYVAYLIEMDREQAAVTAGLASGISERTVDEVFGAAREHYGAR